MMIAMHGSFHSAEDRSRIASILSYWHRLEFFIPFDLTKNVIEENADNPWKFRWLHARELDRLSAEELWAATVPEGEEVAGYNLYLATFEKQEIVRVCTTVLPEAASTEHGDDDERERGDFEGFTCFAKFRCAEARGPDFDRFAVSTVPWALGQLAEEGVSGLASELFAASVAELRRRLENFAAGRAPDAQPQHLTGKEILALHRIVCDWARFVPSAGPIALLEYWTRKQPSEEEDSVETSEEAHPPEIPEAEGMVPEDEDEEVSADKPEVTILNSFFIEDLERAIADVERGHLSAGLAAYLTPAAVEDRINLDSPNGLKRILYNLHPKRINRGHWLDSPSNAMSLMQQFAINTAIETLRDGGLFSINGPPGTGKTTLLRDIVAQNATSRARTLARLSSADEAFDGAIALRLAGETDDIWIRTLRPELSGFGMVVASSNNAAAENVSLELPRKSALGEPWSDRTYLRSVAYKIASQTDKGGFRAPREKEPWGLVSCALGNSKNRKRFKERFWFWPSEEGKKRRSWPGPIAPQTIGDWIDGYAGPTFTEASAAFRALDDELSALIAERQSYADAFMSSEALAAGHTAPLPILRKALGDMCPPHQLEDLKTQHYQRNGLWHDAELAHLRSRLFAAALTLHEAWLAQVAKRKKAGGAGFRANLLAAIKLLGNKFPENPDHVLPIWQSLFMVVPVVSTTFASVARQFRGLGRESIDWLFIDEAGQAVPQAAVGALWRAKRSIVVGDPQQIEPVFTLPVSLIEALAQVPGDVSLEGVAPNRVSAQRLADLGNPIGASVRTGDEALPLWVGSPLRVHRRCHDPMFSLANEIAYDGSMVFGLSDLKAPEHPPFPSTSGWIDIGGRADFRQHVRAQTDFMIEVVRRLHGRAGKLPPLYILSPFRSIKAKLKEELVAALTGTPAAPFPGSRKPLSESTVRKWADENVGTVHTFQGKQADIVFMVLGVDRETAGSADWAGSRPNLLNVAMTRAKLRFFIIGELDLWRNVNYFREAASRLDLLPAEAFLDGLLR